MDKVEKHKHKGEIINDAISEDNPKQEDVNKQDKTSTLNGYSKEEKRQLIAEMFKTFLR